MNRITILIGWQKGLWHVTSLVERYEWFCKHAYLSLAKQNELMCDACWAKHHNKRRSVLLPVRCLWDKPNTFKAHTIRAVASGGLVVPDPHLKSVHPNFTFGLLVAAYIQYSILKMWHPFWFLAPLAAKFWRRACTPCIDQLSCLRSIEFYGLCFSVKLVNVCKS